METTRGKQVRAIACTPPRITQAELQEYLTQARTLQREHSRLRASLTARLEKCAEIEPGELSARIEVEQVRRWSQARMAELVGPDEALRLWKEIATTPTRRLIIANHTGKDICWRAYREQQGRLSDAETPDSMALVKGHPK